MHILIIFIINDKNKDQRTTKVTLHNRGRGVLHIQIGISHNNAYLPQIGLPFRKASIEVGGSLDIVLNVTVDKKESMIGRSWRNKIIRINYGYGGPNALPHEEESIKIISKVHQCDHVISFGACSSLPGCYYCWQVTHATTKYVPQNTYPTYDVTNNREMAMNRYDLESTKPEISTRVSEQARGSTTAPNHFIQKDNFKMEILNMCHKCHPLKEMLVTTTSQNVDLLRLPLLRTRSRDEFHERGTKRLENLSQLDNSWLQVLSNPETELEHSLEISNLENKFDRNLIEIEYILQNNEVYRGWTGVCINGVDASQCPVVTYEKWSNSALFAAKVLKQSQNSTVKPTLFWGPFLIFYVCRLLFY